MARSFTRATLYIITGNIYVKDWINHCPKCSLLRGAFCSVNLSGIEMWKYTNSKHMLWMSTYKNKIKTHALRPRIVACTYSLQMS